MVVEYPTDNCGGGLAMAEGDSFRFHSITKNPPNRVFKKTQEPSAGLVIQRGSLAITQGISSHKGCPFSYYQKRRQ